MYVYRGSAQESVRPLTAIGLPDYVRRIRLVYKWNYWTEKPIYIWTDEEFWRIDRKSGKVEIGYPRRINAAWHFIPQTANAAFTFRNGKN
ncbi:unnamed protein product [Anisakis simplex]|uniref:Uncharacterized protein n=1 Tax=Anisakis simplex TaxID=6269 RepID=A0A3P6NWU1_ANISI|nr:unnamed protein product [Anisakis simplex]